MLYAAMIIQWFHVVITGIMSSLDVPVINLTSSIFSYCFPEEYMI